MTATAYTMDATPAATWQWQVTLAAAAIAFTGLAISRRAR
jgi:hypothetical protein